MSWPNEAQPGLPHRIRLRGPWEVAWIDASGSTRAFRRVDYPGSWAQLLEPRSTKALLRRRFSRPANLDAFERVVLLWEAFPAEAAARLNGEPLDATGHWDITHRLELRNVLEVELPAGRPEALLITGEVRLEIVHTPPT